MAREVYLVLLAFGERREREALELARETIARLFAGAALRTVIVDNRLAGRVEMQLDARTDRVSGDNTSHEFSGWDRGLAWLDAAHRPPPDALVVLANDTIAREDKAPRLRALTAGRAAAAESGALSGWVDAYPRAVQAFGLATRQWVDTSFVVAARRVLDRLRPLALDFLDEDVFTDGPAFFREPSPLSERYRAYLRTWLFGERGDPEQAHVWHAHEPLTGHNAAAFRAKVRALLCEHLLSARARALGVPLADVRPDPLAID